MTFGLAVALLAALVAPAAAHHVGTWTPRDNEISTNFKQLKFSLQARKFDVARRLYETGALRRELRAQAAALPPGLDAAIRAALQAGNPAAAERGLMVFFVALIRDLALEADRQLAEAGAPLEVRAATGRKFLEAIWRYYNLVDFAVTQHDAKAATAIRLAFEDAEESVKRAPPNPDTMRAPLKQIARLCSGVIEASSTSARRDS
jgi:hypothetical protein